MHKLPTFDNQDNLQDLAVVKEKQKEEKQEKQKEIDALEPSWLLVLEGQRGIFRCPRTKEKNVEFL